MASAGAVALLAALATAQSASAQSAQAAATPPAPEATASSQIVVTSSRITRSGFQAPTPTTVVGIADIQKAAEPNVFTAINEIPVLAGSAATSTGTTSSSAGTNGRSTLNLRGLGTNRTLVLIDGQRIVGVDTTGGTDVSQFPQGLIQRVDIVTGGASASWGSDAVAGVVNFIIDKNFNGFKGDVNVGETTYGDDQNAQIQLTAGSPFANGRGHIEASGEYASNGGVGNPLANRPWYQGWKLLQYPVNATPAGQPQYIASPHVADYLLSPGGIITGQGTSLLPKSAVGTIFGANGATSQLQYGSPLISPYMIGGDQNSDEGWGADLDTKLRRQTFYGRVSYDLTDKINVWATYNYGSVWTSNLAFYSTYKPGNLTIQCDNPYLPTSISSTCGGAGHSFSFGTENADLPSVVVQNERTMNRYAIGGDGSFNVLGTDWKWDASYNIGQNNIVNNNFNQTLTNLYNAAIDDVAGPNGTIVCRSVVAQAQGCKPFNVFGTNTGNSAAAAYFTGTAWLRTFLQEDAASLAFNGEPFSLWAGPVSVAFGGEYRKEQFHQTADACSYTNCGNPLLNPENNWFSGNFHPSQGQYSVKEGFLETVLPLLNYNTWGKADLDLAGRVADYSTAGVAYTYKAGLTWAPGFLDGIKFRGVESRDLRAPNLNDLYAAASTPTGGVTNDFGPTAGQTFIISSPTLSNVNLKPEVANTTELGVVFQPTWLRGFNASIDYYGIDLQQAIGTITAQQEMDLCFEGNTQLCSLIKFGPNQIPTSVAVEKINLASLSTSGIDFELAYSKRLSDFMESLPGTVSLRALGTYVDHYTTDPGIPGQPLLQTAGENSGQIPRWRWTNVESWDTGRFTLTLTERWFSPGVINPAYIQCTSNCPAPTVAVPTINNNQMPGALYFDVGMTYNVLQSDNGKRVTLYFKVDNLMNVPPAPDPQFGSLPINNGTNPFLYDVLGRQFHLGFRFAY